MGLIFTIGSILSSVSIHTQFMFSSFFLVADIFNLGFFTENTETQAPAYSHCSNVDMLLKLEPGRCMGTPLGSLVQIKQRSSPCIRFVIRTDQDCDIWISDPDARCKYVFTSSLWLTSRLLPAARVISCHSASPQQSPNLSSESGWTERQKVKLE